MRVRRDIKMQCFLKFIKDSDPDPGHGLGSVRKRKKAGKLDGSVNNNASEERHLNAVFYNV